MTDAVITAVIITFFRIFALLKLRVRVCMPWRQQMGWESMVPFIRERFSFSAPIGTNIEPTHCANRLRPVHWPVRLQAQGFEV